MNTFFFNRLLAILKTSLPKRTDRFKAIVRKSILARDLCARAFWTALYDNGKLHYDGDLFNFTCVDAKTGKLIWTTHLTREHWSSPAYADGKIYVGSESMSLYVLKPQLCHTPSDF